MPLFHEMQWSHGFQGSNLSCVLLLEDFRCYWDSKKQTQVPHKWHKMMPFWNVQTVRFTQKRRPSVWFVCLRYVSAASLKFHAAPSTVTKEILKLRIRYAKEPIRIRSVAFSVSILSQRLNTFSSLKVRLSYNLFSCGSVTHQDGERVHDLKIFLKLFNGLSRLSRTIICRKWSNSQSTMETKISHQTSPICSRGRSYLAIEILVLRNANA